MTSNLATLERRRRRRRTHCIPFKIYGLIVNDFELYKSGTRKEKKELDNPARLKKENTKKLSPGWLFQEKRGPELIIRKTVLVP